MSAIKLNKRFERIVIFVVIVLFLIWILRSVFEGHVVTLDESFRVTSVDLNTFVSTKLKQVQPTSGLKSTSFSLKLKNFLIDKEESKFEDQDSWVNKNEIFYDPRLTLAIYLNAIRRKYTGIKKPEQGILDISKVSDISLPFNWVDWMDITPINQQLSKPLNERFNCKYIEENSEQETGSFCKDNELNDEELAELGFRNNQQLPGFLITEYPSRTTNDIRILQAKSYALYQKLDKPFKVIILNDNGGTYEFNVEQQSNKRMITSDLIYDYIDDNRINLDQVKQGNQIELDHLKSFRNLQAVAGPKLLNGNEKISDKVSKTKKHKWSKKTVLSKQMFVYSKEEINERKSEQSERSDSESMFYESLDYFTNIERETTYFKSALVNAEDERYQESDKGLRYDWRFFNGVFHYKRDRYNQKELYYRSRIIIDRVLRNWSKFAKEKEITYWLSHGSLKAWYWNGLTSPFDDRVTIQMPIGQLIDLAMNYNRSVIVEDPTEGYGRYYLEVGTFIHNRQISGFRNQIDAKFIDVDSGVSVNIMALALDETNQYHDKGSNSYGSNKLTGLKYSMLNGVPIYIPSAIYDTLMFENPNGLKPYYDHWYFVEPLHLWILDSQLAKAFPELSRDSKYDRVKILDKLKTINNHNIFLLLKDEDILLSYFATRDLTLQHEAEHAFLFDEFGDNILIYHNYEQREQYNTLVANFKDSPPLTQSLWEFEIARHI